MWSRAGHFDLVIHSWWQGKALEMRDEIGGSRWGCLVLKSHDLPYPGPIYAWAGSGGDAGGPLGGTGMPTQDRYPWGRSIGQRYRCQRSRGVNGCASIRGRAMGSHPLSCTTSPRRPSCCDGCLASMDDQQRRRVSSSGPDRSATRAMPGRTPPLMVEWRRP